MFMGPNPNRAFFIAVAQHLHCCRALRIAEADRFPDRLREVSSRSDVQERFAIRARNPRFPSLTLRMISISGGSRPSCT